ncbi:hypothetical protein MPSEU_000271300 [Mayamaea pseudoterrestris]|nr:hypothetical protein MPSEU_000271300 [Mayamaea pseudoterrestris]
MKKALYFDFLQCAVDPRKHDNFNGGSGTVWANIGAQQFHLPEGKPNAQVLDGIVTLAYSDLSTLQSRYENAQASLQNSQFSMERDYNGALLLVKDPWGNTFRLVQADDESERDARGQQPGEESEGLAMRDLTIYTSHNANMAGFGRFYDQVLGAPILQVNDQCVVVSVGPRQTLTFCPHRQKNHVQHDDLVHSDLEPAIDGKLPRYASNYGPHVSMYVADLPATYQRVEALGALYANPRFKRRAYTLDQAIDDCMFRCIDIIDPEDVDAGPILRLEHEIRSVVLRDGSKYKSCPFVSIPNASANN